MLTAMKTAVLGGVSGATFRIIVLAITGQSNDKGRNPGLGTGGGITASDIVGDPRILQWSSAGTSGHAAPGNDHLIAAAEPLYYPASDSSETATGHAMAFANTLLPTLSASDVIILVPLAYGGTGYSDGHWAVGGDLYLGAIARLSALKAYIVSAYPGAAIEWNFSGLSGEAETTSTHKAYLDSVTASFDGIIAGAGLSNVGVLLNRMSPSWVSTTVGGNAIDSAQVRLRERYARTWVMDSPDGPYDPGSSNIHFNADAQVARGHRKASKYAAMRARTTPFNQRTDWCDALSAGQYAAYSLWRRLANGYSGPLFKINTAATGGSGTDIGVDANGFVDLTAVAAAIGSADGYVEVLYDQSGNARHFSTTGSVNRPRIATAGDLRCWIIWKHRLGGPVREREQCQLVRVSRCSAISRQHSICLFSHDPQSWHYERWGRSCHWRPCPLGSTDPSDLAGRGGKHVSRQHHAGQLNICRVDHPPSSPGDRRHGVAALQRQTV